MAKRKTTARKTRQSTSAAADSHPYRTSSNTSTPSTKATRYSKYASSSPSIASSPSPQPSLDQVLQRRRKGTPVRSPAQGDVSKGIVFAFRIQNDPDLSMAVDILSYDPSLTEPPVAESVPASTLNETAVAVASESSPTISTPSSRRSSTHSDSFFRASSREQWSNDPSSYLTNNVVDLNRNLLILHSRKPVGGVETSCLSTISSRSSSQPSSPPFLDSSSSSSSSSPASSPGSPPLFSTLVENAANKDDDLFTLDSLSSPSAVSIAKHQQLQEMSSLPSRMLRVRGLGAQGRTMQVYLV